MVSGWQRSDNINLDARFVPTPGEPRAATGGFPYSRKTMAEVMRDELRAQGCACILCKGQSLLYRVGTCPRCKNTGREPVDQGFGKPAQ